MSDKIKPYIYLIHSFINAISIAPLQVRYYSEPLLTQHEYCAGVSCWSATTFSVYKSFHQSNMAAKETKY